VVDEIEQRIRRHRSLDHALLVNPPPTPSSKCRHPLLRAQGQRRPSDGAVAEGDLASIDRGVPTEQRRSKLGHGARFDGPGARFDDNQSRFDSEVR
jgi:hypothetical protein